ncbi:MAG: nitrite reductase [Geobacter sp.]|nr:MAG: nitrite reductase [Geobacter sp.]
MTSKIIDYRLDGIYRQRQEGFFMQRVKLPAGVISSVQARGVARIAETFGHGIIHLTTRGSMEIHWLREENLPPVKRELGKAGLTSRGACGGAVRGIVCGAHGSDKFPAIETMARRLQRHFTGNPRFERLPKKFKIGLEADVSGGRHLIQDAGLVLARSEEGRCWYDVWVAGGLGREPQAGFLLEREVDERRIIPLLEAIVRVYASHTPAGKRLKCLVREIGEDELRSRISAEPGAREELPEVVALPEHLLPSPGHRQRFEVQVFAGLLPSDKLRLLADFADARADGSLIVTVDQNLACVLAEGVDEAAALRELEEAGFNQGLRPEQTVFRVCPGAHECLAGLAPTRDIAQAVLDALGTEGTKLAWAISGCPNSCTQPQLADVGIVISRLVVDKDGNKAPGFDLYRRNNGGLGEKVGELLTLDDLLEGVRRIG